MRTFLKAALCAVMLFAGASAARAQVSVGVGIVIGQPPPPRVVRVLPPSPGPEYFWVAGYWYPVRGRYLWHQGYWARPPYAGAVWVAPRYESGRYFAGYWHGPRGRVEHDGDWDHKNWKREDKDWKHEEKRERKDWKHEQKRERKGWKHDHDH
jgi:hypothetical protein